MPIYDQTQLENIPPINVGIRVEAAAALITNALVTKFTVTGGNVLMTGFYGEIIVVMPATATTVGLLHTPTVGTVSTISPVAGGTDIQTFAAGRMAKLPAALAGILTWTATAYGTVTATRYVLRPGALGIQGSANPANCTIRWTMFYVPLDVGAYVTGS